MKKTFFIFIICVFAVNAKFACAEEVNEVTLDMLIEEALANNPKVQAVYNEWKAAEYKVNYVKGLPDPIASYSYFWDNVETRVGPQENKYGISQKIPFPGKLRRKGKAQSKHAAMLKEKYEALRREVIKNVKLVYYDIFWVDKAVKITEEEKTIIESLEKVAQRKYESNLTPQQDVIKAQVGLSKLIDKLFLLRQNRKSLEAKMNALLNRHEGSVLGSIADVEPEDFKYKIEDLHDFSKNSRQELIAAGLGIEKAEYETSLAKLDYMPDVTFGVDFIEVGSGSTIQPNDGNDAWIGKVSINLPIWFGKLNAQLKEKKSILASSKKNYEHIENSVGYEVEDLYFKMNAYRDIISLYETALVPQTEQSFEAARIGYETGLVDFLNWLDAERVLLQTRLAHYKAIVDYEKSIAYLERIVGRDLE